MVRQLEVEDNNKSRDRIRLVRRKIKRGREDGGKGCINLRQVPLNKSSC